MKRLAVVVALVLAGCSASPAETTPPEAGAAVPPERELHPTLERFRPLLGKTLEQAEAWLAANETHGPDTDRPGERIVVVRAMVVDGQDQVVTMDLRADRLNVELERGVIVHIFQPG